MGREAAASFMLSAVSVMNALGHTSNIRWTVMIHDKKVSFVRSFRRTHRIKLVDKR